jgi:hypothetical protein
MIARKSDTGPEAGQSGDDGDEGAEQELILVFRHRYAFDVQLGIKLAIAGGMSQLLYHVR